MMHFVLKLKMRMSKKINNFVKKRKVLLALGFVIVVILVGGYIFSQRSNEKTKSDKDEIKQITGEEKVQENLAGKEAQQESAATSTTSPQAGTSTSTPQSTQTVINDVTIQAIKNQDNTIGLSLYGPQGVYSVEKCSSYQSGQCAPGWASVVTNQSYSGHGGLAFALLSSGESKATYLVYQMANGQKVATSKPITVDRALINDVKTFIGE